MTWPDNTRSCVDVCALMTPRLRINGDPSCKEIMEFLIVTELEPVNWYWSFLIIITECLPNEKKINKSGFTFLPSSSDLFHNTIPSLARVTHLSTKIILMNDYTKWQIVRSDSYLVKLEELEIKRDVFHPNWTADCEYLGQVTWRSKYWAITGLLDLVQSPFGSSESSM